MVSITEMAEQIFMALIPSRHIRQTSRLFAETFLPGSFWPSFPQTAGECGVLAAQRSSAAKNLNASVCMTCGVAGTRGFLPAETAFPPNHTVCLPV
jgi:hypothetical protein